MGKISIESDNLRRILSLNLKKQRKKLGFTQEELAEAADLSPQTINDIEGCRMWVSDKTIAKLIKVLHIEAYQLLIPVTLTEKKVIVKTPADAYGMFADLENRVIEILHKLFEESREMLR